MEKAILKLSKDYFEFMACAYPVMSLSDEFYFFPRANKAIRYIDCMECLNKEKIKQDISYVRTLKRNLEKLNLEEADLETQIDHQLLRQSMAAFLREFQRVKVWQNDPNLYLKIAILGIGQIVNKLSAIKPDIREELACRIKQIPQLLNEARLNLNKIPRLHQETAIHLAQAIIDYLNKRLRLSLESNSGFSELIKLNKGAAQAVDDFKTFLKKSTGIEESVGDKESLRELLTNAFSYKRSPEEIFEIASDEYRKTLIELKKTAARIRPSMNWREIISDYKLETDNTAELLNLYSARISNLKDFLIEKDLISIPKMQNIQVRQTPVYLAPIRASASYSCPITRNQKEPAFFYVNNNTGGKNIHQEYIFITAHETYPGHHLLDSIRRNIKNPIRQQIESALFYEGWASYAEGLIEEFGYLNNTRQRLLGLKRQAWRAVRAKLDVGLKINKIKPSDAAGQLRRLGYSPSGVKTMLRHYMLTYGYQLCYTIGKFELEELSKSFVPQMGIKNFHNCLLSGGELPFDLIRRRLKRLCRKDS